MSPRKAMCALVLLAFLAWFEGGDSAALEGDYCAQVKLWKYTDGENGWPDYKKTYDKQCENGKVRD